MRLALALLHGLAVDVHRCSDTDITVTIQQTWTGLLITGRTELSKSHSLSGNFITIDEYSVSYEYSNEPLASSPQTMHAHRGTARLALDKT